MNRPNIRSAIRILRNWDEALRRGTSAVRFDIGIVMNDCGTVGCAAGYLGTRPAMQKRGLKWNMGCDFSFKGEDGFDHHDAMAALFELEGFERHVTTLAFGATSVHRTPGEVADVLQGLLSGGYEGARKVYNRLKEARHAPHS